MLVPSDVGFCGELLHMDEPLGRGWSASGGNLKTGLGYGLVSKGGFTRMIWVIIGILAVVGFVVFFVLQGKSAKPKELSVSEPPPETIPDLEAGYGKAVKASSPDPFGTRVGAPTPEAPTPTPAPTPPAVSPPGDDFATRAQASAPPADAFSTRAQQTPPTDDGFATRSHQAAAPDPYSTRAQQTPPADDAYSTRAQQAPPVDDAYSTRAQQAPPADDAYSTRAQQPAAPDAFATRAQPQPAEADSYSTRAQQPAPPAPQPDAYSTRAQAQPPAQGEADPYSTRAQAPLQPEPTPPDAYSTRAHAPQQPAVSAPDAYSTRAHSTPPPPSTPALAPAEPATPAPAPQMKPVPPPAPEPPPGPKAVLLALGGADRGERYVLGDRTTLGRESTNTIPLRGDTAASRQHCEVVREGTQFRVRDLKSSNGTFVNGEKISDVVLKGGDELKVGRSHFRFEL